MKALKHEIAFIAKMREMGAQSVRVGDVEVSFGIPSHVNLKDNDKLETMDEISKQAEIARRKESLMYGSA